MVMSVILLEDHVDSKYMGLASFNHNTACLHRTRVLPEMKYGCW